MLERAQAGRRPLQHRDPVVAEHPGLVGGNRRRQVRQDAERLRGRGPHVPGDLEVALVVRFALARQVHDERHRGHLVVIVEGGERLPEDPVGVDPRPPRIERVRGLEPGIQRDRDPSEGRVRDPRDRHVVLGREIDEERALPAAVVDARDPAAGVHAARRREQLDRVGHLVERPDLVHAVRVEDRLVRAVLAGQRARVRDHQRLRGIGTTDREREDGNVAFGGARERRSEPVPVPNRLQQHRDHPGGIALQREPEVRIHRRNDLLPARHEQVEPDPPVVEGERGERRAAVGEEGHRPGPQVVRRGEPRRPEPAGHVHEPHTVAAAHGHAVCGGDRRDPLGERRPMRRFLVERRERDDAAGAELGRVGHRRFDPRVRDAEDREVDRLGDFEQRRVAPVAVDLLVPGVHGVDRAVESPATELGHHLPAERACLHRRAYHRDRTSLEHPLEARPRIAFTGSRAHFERTAWSFFAWR